jgi:hypothetical protein
MPICSCATNRTAPISSLTEWYIVSHCSLRKAEVHELPTRFSLSEMHRNSSLTRLAHSNRSHRPLSRLAQKWQRRSYYKSEISLDISKDSFGHLARILSKRDSQHIVRQDERLFYNQQSSEELKIIDQTYYLGLVQLRASIRLEVQDSSALQVW